MNIWTTDCCIYKTTTSGLAVYDVESTALIDFVPMTITSVWADNNYVYAGTTESGVLRSSASGTISFLPYKEYPNITSNDIVYIHGSGDYLCVTTAAGVDRYNVPLDSRDYTTISGLSKCFQISNGDYYYIVNPENPVRGLDFNVFNWKYIKEMTLSSSTPFDDFQLRLDIPTDYPYNIYSHSMSGGHDIRFLDDNLNTVPHYREVWDNTNYPTFWVKLPANTTKVYMLYGSLFVPDTSTASGTFDLFDDFTSDTLADIWEFDDNGDQHNVYTFEDSLIRLSCNTAVGLKLSTKESFSGPKVVEYTAYMEHSYNELERDLDFIAGFDGGTRMYVGSSNYPDEFPHYLVSNSDWGDIQGTKYMPLTLTDFSLVSSENYQSSTADGELLVSSGTQTMDAHQFYFTIANSNLEPDMLIDSVRIRAYDPTEIVVTYGSSELLKSKLGQLRLYAVYSTGGGYTYEPITTAGLLEADTINDIFVTEDTSINGGNVLFLATSVGAMVIEEKRGDEANSNKLIYLLDA